MKKLDFLTPLQLEELTAIIDLNSRYENISFSVKTATDTEVTVNVTQNKSFQENHFDGKRLREIAHETFDKFIGERKLHVMANVYVPCPADVVDDAWLRNMQLKFSIKNKDLTEALGIDKTNISGWTGGLRPLSAPVRAMFYYYFLYLEGSRG